MADRTQRVLAKADPFTTGNLAGAKARIFHLAHSWPTFLI